MATDISRTLEATIKTETDRTGKSILLLGPRQVGKSTLLAKLDPKLTINLADESMFREHVKDPALIRRQVHALPVKSKILIDEVQRLPSILNTIQALIDEKKGWIFLITGSSARKLKRGQANLLPGRVFEHRLFPLTYWELGEQFNLEKVLSTGSLPEIYLQDYGPELLRNYIDIYLREEIQAESLTRNIGSYSRFLDLAAAASGEIINYSALASDSEIPKETLRRFYTLLEETLLIHRLPAYTKIKGGRKALQRERIVFFDLGVCNAILGAHKNVLTETLKGHLFEQWLALQLIAYSSYHRLDWKFSHYRDDRGNEVDLIIDTGPRLLALEIKYSTSIKPKYANGLREFAQYTKKPVKLIIVYRGDTPQRLDRVSAMPYRELLDRIKVIAG
ncbi:MAG: AAA family ATPase [Bdellovibrionota bacterium]